MRAQNTVIFLHIPKAAGSTLNYVLTREYSREETFGMDNTRIKESIERLVGLPQSDRRKIRILRGHMPFGLHRHLPSPAAYVTILREPVSRMISHYHYVLATKAHYLHEEVVSKRMSLHDYVVSGISEELDNGQTRLLAGYIDEIPVGECTDELLDLAIENIENHFLVVGISERFDETLLRMYGALEWRRTPFYVRQNENKQRHALKSVLPETVDAIRERNRLDCKLYEHAKTRFENSRYLTDAEDLSKFRKLNRIYQRIRLPLDWVFHPGRGQHSGSLKG